MSDDDSDYDDSYRKRKMRNKVESEDDEEDEEENEDSEQEETNVRSSKGKKRRRFNINGFIDDEAEVDEDDEEEETYEEFEEIIGPEEVDENIDSAPDARKLDSRMRMKEIMEQNEEEIERYYTEKYHSTTYHDRYGDGEAMADSIAQQSKLPGIKDPNLWVIKCRIGEEKTTVLSLMRKFVAMQNTETPLQIKSVFAKEGLKGYVYVEAVRQNHVKEAIEGINALGMSRYKQTLVPINEMTDVLKVVKETGALKPGQWVRLRAGIFKDDLAMVDFVEDAQNLVFLKLLARIDYERYKPGYTADNSGRPKRFKRPPAQLLDVSKVRDKIQNEGSYVIFAGNRYDSEGYLRKSFRMNAVISDGIKPTLTELEKFGRTLDGSQLAITASMVSSKGVSMAQGEGKTGVNGEMIVTHQFAPGDVVEVCEGDLKNLRGKILSVEGDSRIIVQPNHSDLKDPIPFTPSEIQKHFSQGDHVKVLAGRYEGETGLVIRFDPTLAIVLSDQSMSEMKVVPKNLRLWQEHAVNVNAASHVQMMDLVQVDPQTVGVIVQLERQQMVILTCQNKLVTLKANTAVRRLNTGAGAGRRAAQALDKSGNMIQAKDSVNFTEKPHLGMSGEVRHIYRSWAFIYCRNHLENAGVVVVKSRQLALIGAPTATAASGNSKAVTPLGGRTQSGGAGNAPGGGMPNRGRFIEKKLFGKTARIIAGTLKGLTGIICDATARDVLLELHSQFRKVHVLRENIALIDNSGCILPSQFGATTPRVTSVREAVTPLHGSQTPHAASMTPRPDATPLSNYFLPSMATPAHKSGEEPMTPNSGYSWQTPNDYNRTGNTLSDTE